MAILLRILFCIALAASYPAAAGFRPESAGALTNGIDTSSTDLNGDGRSDLLWRNVTTGQVYRMLMNAFAVSGAALVYTEPNTAWKIIADADFNGDGTNDLLWRNELSGAVYLQAFGVGGVPTGGAMAYTEPNLAWKVVHTPDLNGDGRADLLWWNSSTGQVYAMLMNGASVIAQGFVYTEPNTNWTIAAVGDFAGSGKANQLVWRNSATGHLFLVTVAYSAGVFSQSGAMIYQEPNTAWKVLAAADFNGDGRSDLLWRNDATGQAYMMLMNGASISSQGMVYTEPNLSWEIVAQGDYNADGKADLLWRNNSTGHVFMMLMNGLGIAAQSLVYQEPNIAWRVLGSWDYSGDDTLPATSATVLAGINSMASGVFQVPAICTGDLRINCAGGVPAPTPIELTRKEYSIIGPSGSSFNFAFALQVFTPQAITVQYVPLGMTCTANINNALGSQGTSGITGTATFSSTIGAALANRLQFSTGDVSIEGADVTWNSGCSVAGLIVDYFLSSLESQLAQMLSPLLCGVPGPALFGRCP